MPRPPRNLDPDTPYHITSRAIRGLRIARDDAEAHAFEPILREVAERFGLRIIAWCLLPNHYHLLVASPHARLAEAVGRLNWLVARGVNRRQARDGAVFEGRFRSIAIASEYQLAHCARYIALNPVEAGLVAGPALWPWSSYRQTAGLDPAAAYLDRGALRDFWGGVDAPQRFRAFVRDGVRASY